MTTASIERARRIAALPTAWERAKSREYYVRIDAAVLTQLRDIQAQHAYRAAVVAAADLKRGWV